MTGPRWYAARAAQALLAAALLALPACVTPQTSGVMFNRDEVQEFRLGETTYEQVVARWGQPQSSDLAVDGRRRAVWHYVRSATNGARGYAVGMIFFPDGRLQRIAQREA